MNFHIGKIYNLPSNFFFYKSNQTRLWMEYFKKIKIPYSAIILEPNTSSCIIFPENDDDLWVDMKKFL